jgi:hypothetical protein
MLVGQVVAHTGRLKPLMVTGGAILLLGVGLLCFIGPNTSTFGIAWRLAIVGIGVGPSQNLIQLTIQNNAQAHEMGVATASTQFVRQIGQTVGVAVFGAVLTASLASEMRARTPQAGAERHIELGDLQRMALDRQDRMARSHAPIPESAEERAIRESFAVAVRHGLWLCFAAIAVAFIFMLKTPAQALSDRKGALQATEEP